MDFRRRPSAPRWFATVEGSMDYTDRKSTRLNSSHRCISYAVFCLKKKNRRQQKYANKFQTRLAPFSYWPENADPVKMSWNRHRQQIFSNVNPLNTARFQILIPSYL